MDCYLDRLDGILIFKRERYREREGYRERDTEKGQDSNKERREKERHGKR